MRDAGFVLPDGERPELTIRVVANSDKRLPVAPRFVARYAPTGYPAEFTYRSK